MDVPPGRWFLLPDFAREGATGAASGEDEDEAEKIMRPVFRQTKRSVRCPASSGASSSTGGRGYEEPSNAAAIRAAV